MRGGWLPTVSADIARRVVTLRSARCGGLMTTTSAARSAISVTGLQQSFGDKVVLDGIDLTVQQRRGRPHGEVPRMALQGSDTLIWCL
jgi:hypothetical protein